MLSTEENVRSLSLFLEQSTGSYIWLINGVLIMSKTKLILTSLFVMLMSRYCFAEQLPGSDGMSVTVTPNSGKVVVNTPNKPVHCVKGCTQAEDCRNNEPAPMDGCTWQCNHDGLYRGACDGTCQQIPLPSAPAGQNCSHRVVDDAENQ